MSHSNGIIIAPVDFRADVAQVLGINTGDEGELCTSVAINKWAKHKPFRSSAPGFPFSLTPATPELRSPDRIAAALAANYGFTIPRYAASDFKTHYSDPWTYNKPRGIVNSEHYRALDFDGYLHNCYWQLGPVLGRGLYTIFDGYLSVPAATVFAGDAITFGIRCCDDPDAGLPGLLYPYAFLREQQHNFDLSKYYMGIALLASNNVLWVITGDRMDAHHVQDDVDAFLSSSIPNNAADGALKAIPVLTTEQSPLDSNTNRRTWTNSPQGYLVALDGAYLSLTKSSASGRLEISVVITISGSSVTMAFTLHNQSSSAAEVSNLYGFLMSGDAYANECGTGHNVPSYIDPGAYGFIEQNWPNARQDNPPSFPLNNPPDIHMDDWAPAYPSHLAARAYNANTDFRAANNNSSIIPAGGTVTWSKTINNITGDDFGDYADSGVFLALCVNVVPAVSYVTVFSSWD